MAATATDDWWAWWSWNRDSFLDLEQPYSAPVSGGSDLIVGPLPRRVIEDRIAPALAGVLDDSVERSVRNAALLAYGDTGAAGASLGEDYGLQRLLAHAAHRSRWTSENALLALGRYGHARSARLLDEVLHERAPAATRLGGRRPNGRTRAFAAIGLAEIVARTANHDVRRFAVGSLARAVGGDEAGEPSAASTAVLGLAMAAEQDPEVARAVVAELPDPWDWYADPDADDRVRAHLPRLAVALAATGSPDARVELARRLLDALADGPRAEVQVGLVQAMGRLEVADEELARDLADALVRAARDAAPLARDLAWIALGRRAAADHGDRAANALYRATKKMRSRDEPWIALGLGVFAHVERLAGDTPSEDLRRLVRVSLRRARSQDRAVAWALAAGLARDVEAVDEIEELLEDLGPGRERAATAVALGLTRSREAIPALRALADEASHEADSLEAAAIALGLVGDGERASLLLEAFENACCGQMASAHARALGRLGDGRLVGPLVAALADDDARALERAWNAHALGRLARRDEHSTRARLGAGLNYASLLSTQHATDGSGVLDQR